MLNWFDEPTDLLRQAVQGAAVIADRLVAADGAYELVGDKNAISPPEQRLAIEDEAEKCGLKLIFLKPQIWPGQVAKRTATLKRAARGSEWVLVVDADWKITGNRELIRLELEQFYAQGYEQVTVGFLQPDNPDREPGDKYANEWHMRETDQWRQMPFIYRSMPRMDYDRNHWSIFCVAEDGRKVGMFGASGYSGYQDAKTGYLQSPHLFEHRALYRDAKQIVRNREYISRRDLAVAELGYET